MPRALFLHSSLGFTPAACACGSMKSLSPPQQLDVNVKINYNVQINYNEFRDGSVGVRGVGGGKLFPISNFISSSFLWD